MSAVTCNHAYGSKLCISGLFNVHSIDLLSITQCLHIHDKRTAVHTIKIPLLRHKHYNSTYYLKCSSVSRFYLLEANILTYLSILFTLFSIRTAYIVSLRRVDHHNKTGFVTLNKRTHGLNGLIDMIYNETNTTINRRLCTSV